MDSIVAVHPMHSVTAVRAAAQDRISEFDLKLMDIDSEHLGIPGESWGQLSTKTLEQQLLLPRAAVPASLALIRL